jgi:hypothetical protein
MGLATLDRITFDDVNEDSGWSHAQEWRRYSYRPMTNSEIGRLLRLKGAIEAAAGIPAEASAASALTETYQRLRTQTLEIAEDRELRAEFEAMFPEIGPAPDPPTHPRESLHVVWKRKAEVEAQRASGLLHALAGWVEGLLAPHRLRDG